MGWEGAVWKANLLDAGEMASVRMRTRDSNIISFSLHLLPLIYSACWFDCLPFQIYCLKVAAYMVDGSTWAYFFI